MIKNEGSKLYRSCLQLQHTASITRARTLEEVRRTRVACVFSVLLLPLPWPAFDQPSRLLRLRLAEYRRHDTGQSLCPMRETLEAGFIEWQTKSPFVLPVSMFRQRNSSGFIFTTSELSVLTVRASSEGTID